MGHVVNAKAMRVGWSAVWCDQWYSELLYYSEYLHSIFRIRYYLAYVFTRRHFDKKAIFYSHFEISRHYKNLYVGVYFYSGKLETDYEDYKFNFFYRLYNFERNKDPETREPMFLYMALKLVLIFDWLHFFSCKKFRRKDLMSFIIFLRDYKITALARYLKKLSFRKYLLKARYKPPVNLKNRRILKVLMGDYLKERLTRGSFLKATKAFRNEALPEKNKSLGSQFKLNITKNLRKRKYIWWFLKRRRHFKKNVFTYSKSDVYFFMVLFLSFLSAKVYISQASVWKQPNRNTTLRRFYMAAAAFQEMSPHIKPFSVILGYTFEKLSNFKKVFVDFFLTNNNCVNAKFLSRFIGRKLKQNYPLRELLSPIRKELMYIIAISRQGRHSYAMSSQRKYVISVQNMRLRRSFFKVLLGALFILYKAHQQIFFMKNKVWLNLETTIVFGWAAKALDCPRKLASWVASYYKNKCGYLCFFEYKMPIRPFQKMFMPKIKLLYAFSQRQKFFGFFNMLYNSTYTSKLAFFDPLYFEVTYRMPSIYLKALYINYTRYLKFNYWYYNYRWVVNEAKMNHLKSRIKEFTKANNLKGYKMHLTGRFTRRQRAASYWFSKGKVPLNTISSFVDFAFFTIPLKNSAITVKVWLHKSSELLHTHFLKIN